MTFAPLSDMNTEIPATTYSDSSGKKYWFVPLSQCKDTIKVTWQYPYHKIYRQGKDHGFFVETPTCPKPSYKLKNRTWGFERASYKGMNGWYVYVKTFNNGFNPEDVTYIEN